MDMIDSISSIFHSTPEVYTAKIYSEQYVCSSIHVFLTCGGILDLGCRGDSGGGGGGKGGGRGVYICLFPFFFLINIFFFLKCFFTFGGVF